MSVVVQQILILGQQVCRTGSIVIRTDQCINICFAGNLAFENGDRISRNCHIGIDEENPIPFRRLHPQISSDRRTLLAPCVQQPNPRMLGNLTGTISTAIVNNDNLIRCRVCLQQALQAAFECNSTIENRNNDRNLITVQTFVCSWKNSNPPLMFNGLCVESR